MQFNPIKIKGNKVKFWDSAEQCYENAYLFGRTSFKFMGWLWNNHGNALDWVLWNQELGINNLRIFAETEGWRGHPMFGSNPRVDYVWDLDALRRGDRPRRMTAKGAMLLERVYEIAHDTDMTFEYVIDATLKGERNCAGVIGSCIAVTLELARKLSLKYPNAKILFNFHNEWDAHNAAGLELKELNRQAYRARRWYKERDKRVSFESPGEGWLPEQYPEAVIMVDGGGNDQYNYRVGDTPRDFMLATIHPERNADWWNLPETLGWLKASGKPVFFNESKCYFDKVDTGRVLDWYRNSQGLTSDLGRYLEFMNSAKEAGVHFTIHDEKGMQTSTVWPRDITALEKELLKAAPTPKRPRRKRRERRVRDRRRR